MYVCVPHMCTVPMEARKGHQISWFCSYRCLGVLGTEPGSCASTTSTLNYPAISLVPDFASLNETGAGVTSPGLSPLSQERMGWSSCSCPAPQGQTLSTLLLLHCKLLEDGASALLSFHLSALHRSRQRLSKRGWEASWPLLPALEILPHLLVNPLTPSKKQTRFVLAVDSKHLGQEKQGLCYCSSF